MNSLRRYTGRWPAISWLIALVICACSAGIAADGTVGIGGIGDIDTITIMPVAFPADPGLVDRDEPLTGLYGELDDYIYKALLRKLALKGYVLDRPRKWQRPADWNVDTLVALEPDRLAARLPESATFAALLFVERVASTSDSGGADTGASATVSARIVHRPSATLVWDGMQTGVFREGLGQLLLYGPLVMLITPDKHAAVERAFGRLFEALPEKR